jgi:hypothetical protein
MQICPSLDSIVELSSFESVLSECKPLSLWNAKLEKKERLKTWEDVGGLALVKRTLKETVLWPGKVTCSTCALLRTLYTWCCTVVQYWCISGYRCKNSCMQIGGFKKNYVVM